MWLIPRKEIPFKELAKKYCIASFWFKNGQPLCPTLVLKKWVQQEIFKIICIINCYIFCNLKDNFNNFFKTIIIDNIMAALIMVGCWLKDIILLFNCLFYSDSVVTCRRRNGKVGRGLAGFQRLGFLGLLCNNKKHILQK